MKFRQHRLAVVLCALCATSMAALACSGADTIKTKDGATLIGKVRSFEFNHQASASSKFVIEVDGEVRIIPIHKIESIEFEPATSTNRVGPSDAVPKTASPSRSSKAAAAAPTETGETEGVSHWLTTSSNKRHNSTCKHYKSSRGRSCGPNEGTACKSCGG